MSGDYARSGSGGSVQSATSTLARPPTEWQSSITRSYSYDPYGAIKQGAAPYELAFAHNAEEYNPVTELTYLRARYYAPERAHFLTQDSVLGHSTSINSQNRYSFAEADPINNADPSGHAIGNSSYERQMEAAGGINEIYNFYVGRTLQNAQNRASSAFYSQLNSARATDYTNLAAINSISQISQATANYYIGQGAAAALSAGSSWGCKPGELTGIAINSFAENVNATKDSVNSQIAVVKDSKYGQYQQYQEYLAYQAYQVQLAQQQERQQRQQRQIQTAKARPHTVSRSKSPASHQRKYYPAPSLRPNVTATKYHGSKAAPSRSKGYAQQRHTPSPAKHSTYHAPAKYTGKHSTVAHKAAAKAAPQKHAPAKQQKAKGPDLSWGHTFLDILGCVPVIGTVANGANAAWYAAEGDWVNAGLSAASMIPGADPVIKGSKLIRGGAKLLAGGGGKLVSGLVAGARLGKEVNTARKVQTAARVAEGAGAARGAARAETAIVKVTTGNAIVKVPVLPSGVSQIKHIFRNAKGHVLDTPANRALLERTARNPKNFNGTNPVGNQVFTHLQNDGTQAWAYVRDGKIRNGGVNLVPKSIEKLLGG